MNAASTSRRGERRTKVTEDVMGLLRMRDMGRWRSAKAGSKVDVDSSSFMVDEPMPFVIDADLIA